MTRRTLLMGMAALVLCMFAIGLAAANAADATRPHKDRMKKDDDKGSVVTFKTYFNGAPTNMEIRIWPYHNYSGNPSLDWFWTGPTPAGSKTIVMQPGQYTVETRNPSGLGPDFAVPASGPISVYRP